MNKISCHWERGKDCDIEQNVDLVIQCVYISDGLFTVSITLTF